MAAIMIDIDDLKERVYRMLRNIEDGKYQHITHGVAMGCLSCANTAAIDEMLNKLTEDYK